MRKTMPNTMAQACVPGLWNLSYNCQYLFESSQGNMEIPGS